VAGAMWTYRKARWAILALAIVLATVAVGASAVERWVQELKWASARGERDVAILIDASMSMTLTVDGKSNFQRAIEDARSVVDTCRPGDAVSLILAGPVPRAVIATPTSDREEIVGALEGLAPVGGTMSVLEALNVAAASLSEGHNAAKKIVLITDGQNVGWDVRSEARWGFLAESLKDMPVQPKIICRWLELPKTFRNLAVAEIGLSRGVVGTDRKVKVHAKIMNTGTGTVRPSKTGISVALLVDGASVKEERIVAEVAPKAAETVTFEHRFESPGPRIVTARVLFQDDLAADNTGSRVVNVVDRLSVLIVDGEPSPRPLGGAAAFIDIALTPRPSDEGELKEEDEPETEAIEDVQEEMHYLVEPEVVEAPEVAQVKDLRKYAVVILANVPRLPDAVAKELVAFVEGGGGLLIAPGARVKPTFYSSWSTAGAQPVMPARLASRRNVEDKPSRLEPKTFSHPALALLSDARQSDATSALVKVYWRLEADERDADVRVGGRLHTGEPFLVERKLGRGYVLMTAAALDPSASNLPALKSFVPIMHEMVYYLAAPMMLDPNVAPGSEVTLDLRGHGTAASASAGRGLLAEYFDGPDFTRIKGTQVDAAVNFDWGNGRPHPEVHQDSFSVRWTGWVQPLHSETYTFTTLTDDGARLWVDGRRLVNTWQEQSATEQSGRISLAAGRRYRIKMEYYDDSSDAVAKLLWSSPSQRKEIIPKTQLYPAWATEGLAAAADGARAAEVVTPSQRRCPARLASAEGGLRVTFTDTQEPGLYTLMLPPELADIYAPPGSKDKGVPFVVLGRVEESSLDGLTKADVEMARQHVDLFETERSNELKSAVAGGIPGEELWKYLAIGALFVLLGEIAVSRWIAVQRRLHSTEVVSFGAEAVDVQTFRDRARELLATPRESSQTVSQS